MEQKDRKPSSSSSSSTRTEWDGKEENDQEIMVDEEESEHREGGGIRDAGEKVSAEHYRRSTVVGVSQKDEPEQERRRSPPSKNAAGSDWQGDVKAFASKEYHREDDEGDDCAVSAEHGLLEDSTIVVEELNERAVIIKMGNDGKEEDEQTANRQECEVDRQVSGELGLVNIETGELGLDTPTSARTQEEDQQAEGGGGGGGENRNELASFTPIAPQHEGQEGDDELGFLARFLRRRQPENMRPPLTAEQRLRIQPRTPPQGQGQQHSQQLPQETLVEATPVDMQAYHQQQQQRCRQQERARYQAQEQRRLELQNLPRAITESEYQELVRRRQCKNALYGFSGMALVTLAAFIALSLVLMNQNNDKTPAPLPVDSTKCFKTTQELRGIADLFMQLQLERNYTGIQSEIVQVYGEIEHWCVGDIQDFSLLFSVYRNPRMIIFNRDVSLWNMSSATNMSYMFYGYNVKEYQEKDDFITVTTTTSKFNRDISTWDVGNVIDMTGMFHGAASFNQGISAWDVGNVRHMPLMFYEAASFNQGISAWDVGNVIDMPLMFFGAASFNQDISTWNVSNVQVLYGMFILADSFNQPLDSWDVSGITDMSNMFLYAFWFNQPLDSWNVSGVTDMSGMFCDADSFNQPLDSWDVSGVADMSMMFYRADLFNQPLDSWNVSGVTDMSWMFGDAVSFNQPLDSWNVSGVTVMSRMFQDAVSFNQSLCTWGHLLPKNATVWNMFRNTSCPITDDPDLLANLPGPFCHPCV